MIFLLVRTSWEKIVMRAVTLLVIDQEGAYQNSDWIYKIITMVTAKNIKFMGINVLNSEESKDEKISGIIQDLNIVHLKLWRFLVYLT